MAPMVVLGGHDTLPGRYWGEGQGPSASPSQASILLARLNERARERKAGVKRGILGVGQGKPGEGQGGQEGLGAGQKTPGHTTATAEDRKLREHTEEGKKTVHKGQYYSAEPTQMQPGGEVEPRVNGVKTEESCTGEVKNVKKKKRRRDEEKGESTGDSEAQEILAAQKEGLVSLLDGGGSVAPITNKKSKQEESQWEEELKPAISKTLDGNEESTVIRIKKKKDLYKNEISAVVEESTLMKRKKKNKKEDHVDVEMEISGGRDEDYNETSESQRNKKKRKREREVEETVDIGVEKAQSVQLNDSQEEGDISLSSPRKKKKSKKDKKIEAKEEEGVEYQSSQDVSSFKAQKRKIKGEIGDTNEDLEIEQKQEELPDDRHALVGGDKKRREDGHDIGMKKGKKNKKKTKREQPKSSEVEGFTLLTEVDASKRQKVQRTLPHWLANPTVIGRDLVADGSPVDSLPGLDSSLKDILKQQNIQQLFPVQRTVIPEILASAGTLACRYQPRDVCVSAPTGSGKTLAYVLPLVQTLKSRRVPRIRALVLLPVQELATQVYHVFKIYCRGTPLRVGKAVGHSTLQKEQAALVAHNLDRYHSLIDILVATPGRLADHLRMTCGLDLSAVRYLVLDEADRMLAAEGGDWVGHVQRAIADHQAVWENQPLPRPPLQRLLFSATLSSDPEQLQHVTLHHPKLFTVAAPFAGHDKSVAVMIGQYVRPAELREEYVVVEEEVKPLALHLLVSGMKRQRVLVFTNSVQTTHKLALLLAALSQGSSRVVSEFSSKRDKRRQILSQFAAGKIDVLVSSDAMARGLDVPDIDHVVSYDVTSTTTYVHRIGRTARAGRPGTALSLVTKSTMSEFRQALLSGGERACQLSLAAEELEPYEQQYIDALGSLRATLAEEEQQKRQNVPDGKRKKSKKKQKRKQRMRKRDLRTAQLAQNASKGKGKVSVNANHLHHLKRW